MENNIKQHTLQTGERVLLVPVPSDAVEIRHSKVCNWLSWMIPDGDYLAYAPIQDLPQGNWQLIGISDEITEEQANEMGFISLENFQSLLQSLGCEGRHAVLK